MGGLWNEWWRLCGVIIGESVSDDDCEVYDVVYWVGSSDFSGVSDGIPWTE